MKRLGLLSMVILCGWLALSSVGQIREVETLSGSGAGALLDGDKGDVAVSQVGSVWSVEGAVSTGFVVGSGGSISNSTYFQSLGLNNDATNVDYGLLIGTEVNSTHDNVILVGIYGDTPAPFSRAITDQQVEPNDCREWEVLDRQRTTDATQTGTVRLGFNAGLTSKTVSGSMRILVHAQQDGSTSGDSSANYDVGTWESTAGFRWDGTNGYLWDSSTTSGPSASPSLNVAAVRDDITVAALPALTISSGVVGIQVTGHATKTINWVVELEVISTLVTP